MCMKLRPVRLENIYVLREREKERKREYVKDGYVEFVSPRISFEGKSILLKNQPLNFQKSFHLHISTFFP